jgi:hypothetical protein
MDSEPETLSAEKRALDFLCLGAQKSGTTFVTTALRGHPDIQLPASKELYYFSPIGEYKEKETFSQCNFGKSLDWYMDQFERDHRKCGEISTHYLFDARSAERIQGAFPGVKLFAILRNPVDRAFSQYNMERHKTVKETRPLLKIINDEPDNEILGRGLYFQQLTAFSKRFKPEQLRVYLFEDMISNPASFFEDLFTYIDVDASFHPPAIEKRMNKSRRTRFPIIPRAIRFTRHSLEALGLGSIVAISNNLGAGAILRRFNHTYNQVPMDFRLSAEEKLALQHFYAEDISKLEGFLDRSLSKWQQ